MSDEVKENQMKLDNWVNSITGLNTSKDKRAYSVANWLILGEIEAEQIYASDDVARRIIDDNTSDMVREGFKFKSTDIDEELNQELLEFIEEKFNWKEKFIQGLRWAAIYGGAGLVPGVDDGSMDTVDPLNKDMIKSFDYMNVFTRYELPWVSLDREPSSQNFGMPDLYQLNPKDFVGSIQLHWSRIIRFEGAMLPRQAFRDNRYWHDSILTSLQTPLSNYSTAFDSVATIMQDFAQTVFKISSLEEILATKGGPDKLKARLQMIELSRSIINAAVIGESEELARQATPLTGIDKILEKMTERLVVASGQTHTSLLGEAPGGGIGANGRSEKEDHAKMIAKMQDTKLKKPLMQFLELAFLDPESPTGGKVPESWDIEFNPIDKPTEAEEIEMRSKQAATDKTYIENQVLDPREVRKSRFGGMTYSAETSLIFSDEEDLAPEPEPEPEPKPTDLDKTDQSDLTPEESVTSTFKETHKHFIDIENPTDQTMRETETSRAIPAGEGMHYHETPFGPTEPASDIDGHAHVVKTNNGEIFTGPSIKISIRVGE